MKAYKFWFVVGSQFLYGEETLKTVEKDCREIVKTLNESGSLPYEIVYKDTVKTADGAEKIVKEANFDDDCAGIITFCHTFSSAFGLPFSYALSYAFSYAFSYALGFAFSSAVCQRFFSGLF